MECELNNREALKQLLDAIRRESKDIPAPVEVPKVTVNESFCHRMELEEGIPEESMDVQAPVEPQKLSVIESSCLRMEMEEVICRESKNVPAPVEVPEVEESSCHGGEVQGTVSQESMDVQAPVEVPKVPVVESSCPRSELSNLLTKISSVASKQTKVSNLLTKTSSVTSEQTKSVRAENKRLPEGHGFWDCYRSSLVLNRALTHDVPGVHSVAPFRACPMRKHDSFAPNDCSGRLDASDLRKNAIKWILMNNMLPGKALSMNGPFENQEELEDVEKCHSRVELDASMPEDCTLEVDSLVAERSDHRASRDKEPLHNHPQKKVSVELLRASDLVSLALDVLLEGLEGLCVNSETLGTELAQLAPQVADLLDLSALLANRAVVNADIASGKIRVKDF